MCDLGGLGKDPDFMVNVIESHSSMLAEAISAVNGLYKGKHAITLHQVL